MKLARSRFSTAHTFRRGFASRPCYSKGPVRSSRLFLEASASRARHIEDVYIHFLEPLSHPSTLDRVLRGGVREPDAGPVAPGLSLAGGAFIDSCCFSS